MSRQRVAMAQQAVHDQSSVLHHERAKVVERQDKVEQQWDKLWRHVETRADQLRARDQSSPSDCSPGVACPATEVSNDDAAAWTRLRTERAELEAEKEHVRQVAAFAHQRVLEALQVSRDQAKRWEDEVTASRETEALQQMEMRERLEVESRSLASEFADAEFREKDRVAQAAELTDKFVRAALEAGRNEVLRWEVHAAEVRNSEAECMDEAKEVFATREREFQAGMQQEESRILETLRAEAFRAREQWEERTEENAQQQLRSELQTAETAVASRETSSSTSCAEAHKSMVSRVECADDARMAQIRKHVEQTEVRLLAEGLEKYKRNEDEFIADTKGTWAREKGEWESRLQSFTTLNEASLVNMQASADSCADIAKDAALQCITLELQTLSRQLASTKQAHAQMREVQIAAAQSAHQANRDAVVVKKLAGPQQAQANCEGAWEKKLADAEAARDRARVSASEFAERERQLQQDYQTRIEGLLAETARLQEETARLKRERESVVEQQAVASQTCPHYASDAMEVAVKKPTRLNHSLSGADTSVGSRFSNTASFTILDALSTSTSSAAGLEVSVLDHTAKMDNDRSSWIPGHPDSQPATHRHVTVAPQAVQWPGQADDSELTAALWAVEPSNDSCLQGETDTVAVVSGSRRSSAGRRGPLDDIPPVYKSALLTAERNGWVALHPRGEPPAWTVLHWAAAEDRMDICVRLLGCHADPLVLDDQGRSALDCAQDAGTGGAWRVLSKAMDAQSTPAESSFESFTAENAHDAHQPAAHIRTTECYSKALSTSADDASSIPPVYIAAINAVQRFGWIAVHHGEPEWTALHWAASKGRADLCAQLLACKAPPDFQDNIGRTAIDYAKESGCLESMQVLLRGTHAVETKHAGCAASAAYVRDQCSPAPAAAAYPCSVQMQSWM